jgi:hypothetical protein
MTDWRSICAARHNVLIEGEAVATDAVLCRLEPHLRTPVVWMRPEEPVTRPTGEVGTLVLQNVAALGADDQTWLSEWLNEATRCHVISTSATPLFSLVACGLFDATLYYRLNVLLLHVEVRN